MTTASPLSLTVMEFKAFSCWRVPQLFRQVFGQPVFAKIVQAVVIGFVANSSFRISAAAGLILEGDKITLCHSVGKTKLKLGTNFCSQSPKTKSAEDPLCWNQNGQQKSA